MNRAYKIDLHCHSWYSADAVDSPEAMVAAAKAKGLDGIALTDHDSSLGCQHLLELGLMRADGRAVDGFLVIPGQEIGTASGHLLALGISLPRMKGVPALEACALVHREGGFVVAPHPFDRFRAGIRRPILEQLELNAVEVFNAATTFKRHNAAAREFAVEHGLPQTAGSDAHNAAAVGTAFTWVEAEELSVRAVFSGICRGTQLREQYLTMGATLRKTWGNWRRLKRREAFRG